MKENSTQGLAVPGSGLAVSATASKDVLTDILRDGAQRLLSQAVEAEVTSWLETHQHVVDDKGHRQVVGNGHLPARTVLTGIGSVEVRQPRVHDRRIVGKNDDGESVDVRGQPVDRFRSHVLPCYYTV